jgi:osmoprotectant transport system substrate-binding protein
MTRTEMATRSLFTRRGLIGGVLLAALSLSAALPAHSGLAARPAAKGSISIGTKNFGEEYVISDMYRLLLEKHGYTVGKTHDLAQTSALQKALLRGDIDLYPEYTGTGLGEVLGRTHAITNPTNAFNQVRSGYRKFHLTWLAQSKMNDTNSVAVTSATAKKYGLHTLSDLAGKANQLSFAGLPDCKDRPDCLGGLKGVYHANFKKITFLTAQPVMYKELKAGNFDAIEVFTTDAPIKAFGLVVLKDNKHIFPADHIAPVIRDSVLKQHPDIAGILNPLARYITTDAMIKMNVQVVLNGKDPMAVATAFLKSKKLI